TLFRSVGPTVILFLQLRALIHAACVEVRIDELRVKAADRYRRLRRRIVGVPDVEAEVDNLPAVLGQKAIGFVFPGRDEVVFYPGVEEGIHRLRRWCLCNSEAETGFL